MRPLIPEVELAELSHRLITSDLLRQHNVSRKRIRSHLERGLLHEVLPKVYSFDANTDDFLIRGIALCLKYPTGYLSGAASSRYWELRRGIPNFIEFTLPESVRPYPTDWAQFRFVRTITEDMFVECVDGLRVSSPARAVFEAASRLDGFGLRSMIEDGIKKGLFTAETLGQQIEHYCGPGKRGSRLYRAVIEAHPGGEAVHSEEELLLAEALVARGLEVVKQYPLRLANRATIHLDLGIPASQVGAEIDGPTHDDPIAVHRDKSRDLMAAVRDWQVLRVPTDDIRKRLRVVAASFEQVCRRREALLRRTG